MIKQLILRLFKKYKLKFISLFLCVIVTSTISSFYPLLFSKLIDSFVIKTNINEFLILTLLYGLVFSFEQLLHFQLNILWSYLCTRIIFDLRLKVFKKYYQLPNFKRAEKSIGNVVKTINEDCQEFSTFIHNNFFYLVANFIQLLVSVIVVYSFSKLFFIVLIIFVPLNVFITNYFTKRIQRKQGILRDEKGKVSGKTYEILEGINDLKIFGMFSVFSDRFSKLNMNSYRTDSQIKIDELFIERVGSFLMMSMTLVMYTIITVVIGSTPLSVGMLIAVIEYYRKSSLNLTRIINSNISIKRNVANMQRVADFLDIDTSTNNSKVKFTNGKLSIDNLSYSYENNNVLKNISFEVEKGEKVAIVGESGSGKSTLLSLIGRKNEYHKGSIKLAGTEIKDINRNNFYKSVSYMSQNTITLNDSIINNIIPRKSSQDRNKVENVVKKVCLDKTFKERGYDLDSVLDSENPELSGGEIQRLGLARVLAQSPNLLLLDEPTSNLDYTTEKSVLDSIFEEFKQETVVIVSHKITTISKCNKIIFMSEGEIIDIGTHNELLNNSNMYSKMFFEKIEKEAKYEI